MPGSVKGPGEPSTSFDRLSEALERSADTRHGAARKSAEEGARHVGAALEHSSDAFVNLAGAGAEAMRATNKLLEGTGHAAAAAGHAAAGVAYGTAGALGWTAEGLLIGSRYVAKNVAKGFSKLANLFAGRRGPQVTVVEIQSDPTAKRFSERMFDKAGKQFERSGKELVRSWSAYVEAIDKASSAGESLLIAVGHTAAVAGHLARAAGESGVAGAEELGAFGVRLAAAAVQAAEQGVVGARELAILGAKFSAATANLLAYPEQGKVEVKVGQTLESFRAELRSLSRKHEQLAPLVSGLAPRR